MKSKVQLGVNLCGLIQWVNPLLTVIIYSGSETIFQ